MDDSLLVCRVNCVGDRRHRRGCLAGRPRDAVDLLRKSAALDQLHREVRPAVGLAGIVHLHDVRVVQTSDRLQRDRAVEPQVPGRRFALAAGPDGR